MTIHSAADLTTAALAANAFYLGPLFDGGTEPANWPTRVRPAVVHGTSAKTAHGHLILEELIGGAWAETHRAPIPADGEVHTFDWPLHSRYHRLKFVNGGQTQTVMRLSTVAVRDDGGSIDERSVLAFLLSTAPLGANASVAWSGLDLGPNHTWTAVRFSVRSDQSGVPGNSMRIEYSDDGASWWADDSSVAQYNAASFRVIESRVQARYVRASYYNAATAQAAFRAALVLVSL